MSLVTEQDVQSVARLARLALRAEEITQFTQQLETILEYMRVLKDLSTDGVEPMWHVLPLHNVSRPDLVTPSLPVETVLAAVPQRQGAFVRVPPIIETP